MKRELFALTIVLVLLVAFPASLFAYQAWRTSVPGVRVIALYGNSPANGGWQPDTIRVDVGERVRLRIAANDVVHGFSVPALGIQVDEIQPGHVEVVDFVASQAGRFPFACTRWCSVDHWRMRGVIEVVDPAHPQPTASVAPPLYQQLKIDIDALHPAQHVPQQRPSASRGARLNIALPLEAQDQVWLRAHSPDETFALLRNDPALQGYGDSQAWDAVAWTWQRAAGADAISRGQKLFARDCAACHGETGQGNGPAGVNLPGRQAISPGQRRGPANLTDAAQMLGASDVLLQGKILRGGMGTGMPEWGSLYDERDMWDAISYVRSFVFDYGPQSNP